jgi:hypothetical protein
MKASTDTRLMSGAELIPELLGMELETGMVPRTGIESTVGFEINSVVGSGMSTVIGSGRSSESSEEVSSSDGNFSGWPKQTEWL